MSNNLKARVKKLEEVANPKGLSGIVIRYENRVMGKDKKGFDIVVDADYYLNEDRTEPITRKEISELGKQYICFLPIRRERPQAVEVKQ